MKRLALALVLALSVILPSFSFSTSIVPTVEKAQAATCYAGPNAPYETASYTVAGYSNFYCNINGNKTFKVCVYQSGIAKGCRSIITSSYNWSALAQCWRSGAAGVAAFQTRAFIYNSAGSLIYSTGSGYSYLHLCY